MLYPGEDVVLPFCLPIAGVQFVGFDQFVKVVGYRFEPQQIWTTLILTPKSNLNKRVGYESSWFLPSQSLFVLHFGFLLELLYQLWVRDGVHSVMGLELLVK